jgi:sec-independent protein translocase protein TatA
MNSILLFLNMSGGEILVIVLVAYLVLGPKKIPEVARMIGKGINELRRATDDIRTEITREVNNIKKEANLDFKDTVIPDAYKRTTTPQPETSSQPDVKAETKGTEEEMK